MTDTARTLAAVKALLADNTSGAISPQDIRDFLESIVDPTPGGGFGSVEERFLRTYCFPPAVPVMYHSTGSGTPVLVTELDTDGGYYLFDLDAGLVSIDPGWINRSPLPDTLDWVGTLPAKTTLGPMPVGIYSWTMRINCNNPPVSGAFWVDMWVAGDVYATEGGPISSSQQSSVSRDAFSHALRPAAGQVDPKDSNAGGFIAVDRPGLFYVPYLFHTNTEAAAGTTPLLVEFTMVKV